MVEKALTQIARKLRIDATDAEKRLWWHLRGGQVEHARFRRQQPVGKYIADFVNLEKKLVIEIDGSQHGNCNTHDKERDEWLRNEGFNVLRFWNNDIFENLEGVLETIRRAVVSPSPTPPTRGGD